MPRRGLEPPFLAELVPKTSASTNFATSACASRRIARMSSEVVYVYDKARTFFEQNAIGILQSAKASSLGRGGRGVQGGNSAPPSLPVSKKVAAQKL